jgi:beta-1,4-mannosyl-glycoprotein beta-1,4-N-acetylglucosaminyltransferase
MIYDCFMFCKELDILEIRLNTLDEYVDYFVINESPTTFSGNDKPLYYSANKERFEKFHHKIIYQKVDFIEGTFEDLHEKLNWARQIFQRNALIDELTECYNDDIIICSDVDEIPDLETLLDFYTPNELFHLEMDLYNYFLNTKWTDFKWVYPTVCNYGYLKDKTLDSIRHGRDIGKTLPIRGWHFSSIGDERDIEFKYKSVSDEVVKKLLKEYDNVSEIVDLRIKKFAEEFNSTLTSVPIILKNFPEYVVYNQDRFNYLIKAT